MPPYLIAALILMTLPSAALGHDGHDPVVSFYTGFGHPLGGLDHLFAGAGVGMLAMLRAPNGWRNIGWPIAFLFGGALGFVGGQVVGVGSALEFAIVPATLLLLLWLWRADLVPTVPAIAAAAAVGLSHGFVHADVVRGEPGWADFGMGAQSAMLLLVGTGMAMGILLRQLTRRIGHPSGA